MAKHIDFKCYFRWTQAKILVAVSNFKLFCVPYALFTYDLSFAVTYYFIDWYWLCIRNSSESSAKTYYAVAS